MSDFDDNFAASAAPALLSVFGDTDVIVYHPADGGDSVTLDAIVRNVDLGETEELEQGGRDRSRVLEFVIQTDPTADGGGVASPEPQAEIEYASNRYHPDGENAISITGTFATIRCRRAEAIERARPGYRG